MRFPACTCILRKANSITTTNKLNRRHQALLKGFIRRETYHYEKPRYNYKNHYGYRRSAVRLCSHSAFQQATPRQQKVFSPGNRDYRQGPIGHKRRGCPASSGMHKQLNWLFYCSSPQGFYTSARLKLEEVLFIWLWYLTEAHSRSTRKWYRTKWKCQRLILDPERCNIEPEQARSQPFFPFKPARYSELSMRDFSQVAWPQEPQLRYHAVRNGSLWAGGMMYATGPYVLQWVHASEY